MLLGECNTAEKVKLDFFIYFTFMSFEDANLSFSFTSFCNFCTLSFLKVAEIKDNQIRGTLKNLETSIHHWDSDKCPAVK